MSFLGNQESSTLKLFKSLGYLALHWIPAVAGMTSSRFFEPLRQCCFYPGMISNAFKKLSKYYRKYKSNLVMTIRKFHYLTLLITIIAICSLFSIKERVSTLDYQLSSVVKQINSENNNIHILKAEQAYLLLPARLEKLAAAYLKLETVKSYQMIKDPLGPNIDQNIKFNHNISISKSSKWRYKRITNNKYIQTVSSRTKP